jgi:hypothetical protein
VELKFRITGHPVNQVFVDKQFQPGTDIDGHGLGSGRTCQTGEGDEHRVGRRP